MQHSISSMSAPRCHYYIWITIASPEQFHLKSSYCALLDAKQHRAWKLHRRFFGLVLANIFCTNRSSRGRADKALNSFFPCRSKTCAHTVTNEGKEKVDAFYFNIDYRACAKPLAADTLYFHAQYRQQSPAKG